MPIKHIKLKRERDRKRDREKERERQRETERKRERKRETILVFSPSFIIPARRHFWNRHA